MSARAGIVVTGTEVLTGRVSDRNGPWLAERLRELGVDLATIVVVGDRPDDMRAALAWLADEGVDLIVTSGGLGPTADDLTAEVVGDFQGRAMVLDEPLRGRIAAILEGIARRWPGLDLDALEDGNRKQATIPLGATILEPVGTAPGLVVTPADGRAGPAVVVLPGPPRELQPMWATAVETDALRAAVSGRTEIRQEMLRLFGIPESEIAETLRARGGRRRRPRRRWRSRPACAAGRSRSSRATTRPSRASTTRSRPSSASATPRPSSPTTARRSTSRSPRC